MQTGKAPQRPKLNQGRIIDSTPTEDQYILQEDQRLHCVKCNAYRYHDIFGVVSGDEIITIKIITHCRDCGFEVEKDAQPVGKVG